jgi:hypothetical protein
MPHFLIILLAFVPASFHCVVAAKCINSDSVLIPCNVYVSLLHKENNTASQLRACALPVRGQTILLYGISIVGMYTKSASHSSVGTIDTGTETHFVVWVTGTQKTYPFSL